MVMALMLVLFACVKSQVQVDSYEMAWRKVNENYPYEDFGGLDWQAVHDELLPKARRAKNNAELKPIIMEMVGRLGESHFGVISMTSQGKQSAADAMTRDEQVPFNQVGRQGWLGLDARWVNGKMLITSCNQYAVGKGFVPGMEIVSFNGQPFTSNVLSKRKQDNNLAFKYGISSIRRFIGTVGRKATFEVKLPGKEIQSIGIGFRSNDIDIAILGHLPPQVVRFEHLVLPSGPHVIRFNTFMMPIRKDLEAAFAKIASENPPGLIIDLRGNLGGLGGLGIGLAGHLISKKDFHLGEQITRNGNIFFDVYPRMKSKRFEGKVAILVDELSVSTSEIVAGGLQDIGRARVFGTKTPGMALPSVIVKLPNGDSFQYAIADLKKPSGGRYEGEGVTPDVVVANQQTDYVNGDDLPMKAAVKWLLNNSKD